MATSHFSSHLTVKKKFLLVNKHIGSSYASHSSSLPLTYCPTRLISTLSVSTLHVGNLCLHASEISLAPNSRKGKVAVHPNGRESPVRFHPPPSFFIFHVVFASHPIIGYPFSNNGHDLLRSHWALGFTHSPQSASPRYFCYCFTLCLLDVLFPAISSSTILIPHPQIHSLMKSFGSMCKECGHSCSEISISQERACPQSISPRAVLGPSCLAAANRLAQPPRFPEIFRENDIGSDAPEDYRCQRHAARSRALRCLPRNPTCWQAPHPPLPPILQVPTVATT
jgi:hypothetical protein